jgi:hypothetical protein
MITNWVNSGAERRLYSSRFYLNTFSGSGTDAKVVHGIKYDNNSIGYRAKEPGPVDLLVAGCSQTYGHGVSSEATWGSFVAKELNVEDSFTNLGVLGSSIMSTVSRVVAYCREYGYPKYVFCAFPDRYRIDFPLGAENSDFTSTRGIMTTPETAGVIPIHINIEGINENPKYQKRPLLVEETFSPGMADLINFDYIRFLTEIFALSGTVFRWSVWDTYTRQIIDATDLRSDPNYVDLTSVSTQEGLTIMSYVDKTLPSPSEYDGCHKDLAAKYGDNFYFSYDNIDEKIKYDINRASHWGVHSHAHVAEKFLASIGQDILDGD